MNREIFWSGYLCTFPGFVIYDRVEKTTKDLRVMSKRLEVVYENGVLRPLEPVDVCEQQRGAVTLIEPEEDWLDTEYMDSCAEEVQEHVSLETVRQILAKIPESLDEEIRAERDAR